MPKILINEIDKTSPGAPGDYANFSVLIAGFMGTPEKDIKNDDKVNPDSNGIYEFSSAEAFKNNIGLVGPKENGHYGNQMAYELLGLGYSIIYKPIQHIDELKADSTWEIFKDKATYDFRFIVHGLLTSYGFDASYYNEIEKKINLVNEAISVLDNLPAAAAGYVNETYDLDETPLTEEELKELIEQQAAAYYLEIKNDYEGFKNQTNDATIPYDTLSKAITGTEEDLKNLKTIWKQRTSIGTISTATINQANKCIAKLAEYTTDLNSSSDTTELPGRGDCIALIELDEASYVDTTSTTKPENLIIDAISTLELGETGQYAALTIPSVIYKRADAENDPFDNNKKFPGGFHYLTCFINSLQKGFREWYAAAGYTRGVSPYSIDYTSVKLGEIAINALEPRNQATENDPVFACNVIANFRGSYYLWGNRTAKPLGDSKGTQGDLVAGHFLNIRQLCTTIKKQLYVSCRRFTFDPNSDTLWFNFVNAIKPTLEAMKADQGIRDYKILKVTDNPKKATLRARIRIIPIEAVEDFDLTISLEDSFGETAAVVTE